MTHPTISEREQRVHQLAAAIRKHPGRKPAFLAGYLSWTTSQVNSTLLMAEEMGLLLFSEDEQEGLHLVAPIEK